MIEFCTKKRMAFVILILIGLSFVVLFFESVISIEHKLKGVATNNADVGNTTFGCWSDPKNTVKIINDCYPCNSYEMKAQSFCKATGYREHVECTYPSGATKETSRSCPKLHWFEERKFWTFEAVCALTTFVSYGSVFLRQKKLDKQLLEKVHKQIAAGV